MPKKQKTPCRYPGCVELSEGRFCEKHTTQYRRVETSSRRSRIKIYSLARWRKLRMFQLRRHPLCNVCGGAASTVDHIIPIEQGGDPWDINNLQTICFQCHQEKRAREAQMAAKGQLSKDIPSDITLVYGPPASGKTTYVRNRASYGDIILSLDRMFISLTGLPKYEKPDAILPYAQAAYDAVSAMLCKTTYGVGHVWIIGNYPKKESREMVVSALGADAVLCSASPEECKRRIRKDDTRAPRAAAWDKLIDKWFVNYEE